MAGGWTVGIDEVFLLGWGEGRMGILGLVWDLRWFVFCLEGRKGFISFYDNDDGEDRPGVRVGLGWVCNIIRRLWGGGNENYPEKDFDYLHAQSCRGVDLRAGGRGGEVHAIVGDAMT